MSLTASAPAKVNLYLHVVGKRQDGYHLLESLIAFTEIADMIEVAPSETLSLTLTGTYANNLKAEEDNIVLKAARKLAYLAGIEPNVHITLQKEIPLGAGLGGGSSDAATVLRLLAQLWKLDVSEHKLMEIALSLGADVPVMLHGKTAFIAGIGEVVKPVEKSLKLFSVLVNPGVFLSTPAVFKQGVRSFSIADPEVTGTFAGASEAGVCDFLITRKNDLEVPAITLQPVIQNVLEVLSQQAGCVLSRMSGSGATCFGIFNDEADARNAAQAISLAEPSWWVRSTNIR